MDDGWPISIDQWRRIVETGEFATESERQEYQKNCRDEQHQANEEDQRRPRARLDLDLVTRLATLEWFVRIRHTRNQNRGTRGLKNPNLPNILFYLIPDAASVAGSCDCSGGPVCERSGIILTIRYC